MKKDYYLYKVTRRLESVPIGYPELTKLRFSNNSNNGYSLSICDIQWLFLEKKLSSNLTYHMFCRPTYRSFMGKVRVHESLRVEDFCDALLDLY